ncbi:MAG: hypothetical protein KJN64_04840, partial [Ignavibacteria bacterium]|nr:hypothetical protein [Ignavibacteria bacterium]
NHMPNGNIHKTAGSIFGSIAYLAIQNSSGPNEQVDLGELILSSGVGLSAARIPDLLEPATNPNHRAFFHSIVFGGIIVYIGVQAWKDLQIMKSERLASGCRRWSLNEFVDIAIVIASGSVLIHLIMDGFTKKGLNII